MAITYEPIATTTVGTATNIITFSSIPGSYTDIRLIVQPQSTSGLNNINITFNNESNLVYKKRRSNGTGAAIANTSATEAAFISSVNISPSVANTRFGYLAIDIFSYANTSVYKSLLTKGFCDRNGAGAVEFQSAVYASNSAITTVTLTISAQNFNTGTTATLYGILKA